MQHKIGSVLNLKAVWVDLSSSCILFF